MKGNFYALIRRLFSCINNFSPQLILLVTILFLSFTQVNAKTVVIGSGSGNVSQTSMSGLNPGDVLAITPGTYNGGSFTNLSGITIINNGGLVTFTGLIRLSADVNVTFSGTGNSTIQYGFSFAGSGFTINSRCTGMRFYNFVCVNTGRFVDASENQALLTYTGAQSSILFQNVSIANIKMSNSGSLICGPFGHASNLHNYIDSIAAWNIIYNIGASDGRVITGGCMFRFDFHDMNIKEAPVTNFGDQGLIFIYGGSGQVHNVYRSGGWGWLVRIFGASLATYPNDVWVYNNIDLNGTCYGTAEVRCEAAEWLATGGLVRGINIHIINNTAGNKIDNFGTYNTAVGLIPTMELGYTAEIRNNLSFNNQNPGKDGDGTEFWNLILPPPIRSNNVYYSSYTAAGLVDPVNCYLLAASPAIDKGIAVARVGADIQGIARPQGNAYDQGAREYNQNTPPPVNQPPTANAGNNQTITLPTSSVALDGSASSDADGTIASYNWAQIAGPSTATITNGNAAKPTMASLQAGQYTFELTVTDNSGATAKAQVIITVNAASNLPPVANAGNNQTITLPTNSVTLDGTNSSDPDGTIASYTWAEISGPSATITNSNIASTVATGLQAGTYIFKLVVKDNVGASATAYDTVVVKPASNVPPVANAGADQTITLPTSSVNVDGSASADLDGSVASYSWTQSSGPSAATIASATAVNTNITNLIQGTYVFKLLVTDDKGATASDSVTIKVNAAANQSPVANAGASKSITLPVNTVSLDGTLSSDPDGTIASYSWAQITGPSTALITNGNTATPSTDSLVAGQYTFELTVTDNNGATAKAQVKITVITAGSLPPVANAGADQTITLPTNTVNLDGTASQAPAGSITSNAWTQSSGPSAATIVSTGNATTAVNNLVQGTYVFKLVITDNTGATASDTVSVQVNKAPNKAPSANAGSSKTITHPVKSVKLDASLSSDPDGTITSYSWAEIAGPSTATVTSTNTDTPTADNLLVGQYTFEVTVTDNDGATAKAQVKITVLAAPNLAPIANAGGDKTITLPTSSVSLNGSLSSDPDGTIASYSWIKISGTGSTITNANSIAPNITGLLAGTYIFELTVTDNIGATAKDQVTITVNAAVVPNQAPVANAGADKTITLPISSVSLNGSLSSDPDGTIASYSWVKISGTGSTITNANSIAPNITGLLAGTYIFELTVTDNIGATAKDQVTITVNAAVVPNQPPVANAGANQSITLPTSTVNLNGTSSYDLDGSISTYGWTQVSGPSTASIAGANTGTPTASSLIAGQYVFELTVTDNKGATAKDQITIIVNAAAVANQVPIANAGTNQTITLPTSTADLNGTSSYDPDGSISSYGWTQVSGPSTATIAGANTRALTASNLQAGQYIFELTVTDNKGATAKDQVTITVNAAVVPNQVPIANAGTNQTITLPTSTANLNGTSSYDPDGSISSYGWTQVSGPSTASIAGANTGTPTTSNLKAGQYIFELTVTDNKGATAKDQAIITVNAAVVPNQAPVANAGANQSITLPTSTVILNGKNSYDPDGAISSYGWAQISGPSTASITGANTGTPIANNLKAGQYIFELTVTDNRGATAKDQVTITVNGTTPAAANQPPVANAGNDTTVVLPASSATLDGSASTDPNGTISTYQWQEMAGPNTATLSSFSSVVSTVSNLTIGEYTFKLTVTDNNGATSTANVKVKVVDNLRSTEQILLYPNPAHDVVHVRLISDSNGTVRVNIYDMNGKLIQASQLEKQQSFLDQPITIDRLAGGTYTLQAVIGTNKTMVSKFIKQ